MAKRNKGKLFSGHSKASGSRLVRRILIATAALFLLLIILCVIGYYQLLAYLQGDSFRQKISSTATTTLQADKVDILSNLSIDGDRVSCAGIELARVRNVEQARVGRISAEVNRAALLSRRLHLHKLSLEEASVVIVNPPVSGDTPATASPAKKTAAAKPGKAPQSKGQLQLDFLECKDSDLHFTNNDKTYQILGATISAVPAPKIGKNAWQIQAENARFHTPFSFLRDSSIKSATAIYNGKGLDLTESRIMLTPGEMRARAHYDLKSHLWTCDLQVNKGDIHRLLNDDWKKRLSGEMYGRIMLTGEKGSIRTATGNLSVLNGVLEGLPFLSQLPLGATHSYRTVELEKADCQILYPYSNDQIKNAWMFDKIHIAAKRGMLIIRGQVLVGAGGQLAGKLTIGIPGRVISTLPVPREKLADQLFTAEGPEKGYLWVNVNLSGTLEHPQEDLSVRIAAIVGANLGKMVADIPAQAASGLLNTLFSNKGQASETQEDDEEYSEDEEEAISDDEEEEDEPETGDSIKNAADAAGSLLRALF